MAKTTTTVKTAPKTGTKTKTTGSVSKKKQPANKSLRKISGSSRNSKIVAPEEIKLTTPANPQKPVSKSDEDLKQKQQPSIGSILKQVRKTRDIDVFTISRNLRISERYIHAIESMDRSSLPERVYTLGFVRSYAHHLGIDPEKSVAQFKAELYNSAHDVKGSNLEIPKPVDDTLLPSARMIMFSLVVLSFVSAALWYWNQSIQQSPEEEITELLKQTPSETQPPLVYPEATAESPS